MGVYLKNALMPDNCAECQQGFLSIEAECGWGCWNTAGMYNGVFIDPQEVRHPECPMVEVKAPHGRLIDVTKIPYLECADPEVAELIGEAPTVIEAEVE